MVTAYTNGAEASLTIGIASAKAGRWPQARETLRQYVRHQPGHDKGWLWLAFVAETVEEKRAALRHALSLRPDAPRLRAAYEELIAPYHVRHLARRGVFISYTRSDELVAAELSRDLRAAGVSAWLDMTDISDAGDWHGEVAAALRRCGLMLMIASPDAIADDDMAGERLAFMQSGKIVIPLMHRTCSLDGLNIYYPALDFRQDYVLGLHRLLMLLQADRKTPIHTP